MLPIAQVANKRDDIETEFVLGQGKTAFDFGTIGLSPLWAVGVEAAANLQREPQDGLQSRNGAIVVVRGPHCVAAI
jgi:hypothetical protein